MESYFGFKRRRTEFFFTGYDKSGKPKFDSEGHRLWPNKPGVLDGVIRSKPFLKNCQVCLFNVEIVVDSMKPIILEGEPFVLRDLQGNPITIQRLTEMFESRPEAAAACADPGVCACPRCRHYYWAEGTRQRCRECSAEYETDWWAMLSWGVQAGRQGKLAPYNQARYDSSAVFRWGYAHPDCSIDYNVVEKQDWIAIWAGGPYVHAI